MARLEQSFGSSLPLDFRDVLLPLLGSPFTRPYPSGLFYPVLKMPIPAILARMKCSFLRAAAWAEAASFLVLLGIAMPLKYAAGMPAAVTVMGWVHGVLFVAFGVALLRAWIRGRWPLRRALLVFVAGLVPFGPFLLDRRVKAYEDETPALR